MDYEARYQYLLSLKSVRESATLVYKAAQVGKLRAFDYHPEKLDEAADFVSSVITRDHFPENFSRIPPHGRWQHFETRGVPKLEKLLNGWKSARVDDLECTRRLVDLFVVSVLLDAGAGDEWKYTEQSTGMQIERSEGLAVASLYAFTSGVFSAAKDQVDAPGLKQLSTEKLGNAMQSSEANPLLGLDGRAELLRRLGDSLTSLPKIFGEIGRPGNMVDFLMASKNEGNTMSLDRLWNLLQQLLIPTWPKTRTVYDNKPLGDAWPLQILENSSNRSEITIQTFHKLTQWLTYSLLAVFQRLLDVKWSGTEHLTGLPEYRNGGLYVDMGVLTLKDVALQQRLAGSEADLPKFDASDKVIVEWRAMTVVLLDETLRLVNQKLAAQTKGSAVPLTLAQLLEAGTWKAGRELAAKYRPQTKGSPILIQSDGTLF